MSEHLHLFVPALPIAQPRPRARVVNGRPQVYAAPRTHPVNDFKAFVRVYALKLLAEGTRQPFAEPIHVHIAFYFPRPAKLRDAGVCVPCPGKPDIDNLAKSVLDALNGLLWLDDALICELDVAKWYADADQSGSVSLSAYPLRKVQDLTNALIQGAP